jgi:hypothetical protein
VLVIVQNLDAHEREVMRVLTDREGRVPAADLSSGLYRVIATAPYGTLQAKVDEFLVGSKPRSVVVTVQFLATHGYGDVVTVGPKSGHTFRLCGRMESLRPVQTFMFVTVIRHFIWSDGTRQTKKDA